MPNPFRYLNRSAGGNRLTVMLYVRYLLSLRLVEDILFKRGIDVSNKTAALWLNQFGPMFAVATRKRRLQYRCY